MIKSVLDGLNTAVQAVGNLGTALSLVLGLVTALKAQRIATAFAGMFRINANQIEGMTGSIRSFGAAMTAVAAAVTIANGIINAHNEKIDKAQKASVESGQKAAQSSQEILKLYGTYLSATAGTEAYTTALVALGEALGLTADQAKNAESSIHDLTVEQLNQAASNAKGAMESWDAARGQRWDGFDFLWDLFNLSMSSLMSGKADTWGAIFSGVEQVTKHGSIEDIIRTYRQLSDAQEEMNRNARQMGVNVTTLEGYSGITHYLENMKGLYEEALALMNAYTSAEAAAAIG